MILFSEVFLGQAFLWLFVAVTLFQLAFALLALRFIMRAPLRSIGADNTAAGDATAGVSVILCARNEAENLRRNLSKMLTQDYKGPWELLVVDDASDDVTPLVLSAFQQAYPALRVIRVPNKTHPGKKQALTLGIDAANYDVILLSDADCSPASEHWISRMAQRYMADPDTCFVLGYAPVERAPGKGFLGKWTRFETAFTAIQYFSLAASGMPYMGVGRNLAFRKSVFERSAGFSAHMHLASGDDDLLVNGHANRHNTALCLSPDSFVYSPGKTGLKAWLRQKRRHLGAGAAYRPAHRLALALLALSHTLHFFLLFVLLLLGIGIKTVLVLWLSRSLLLFILYRKAFFLLREPDLLSLFPIYDALFAVYYGVFVPIVLIAKKTHSWN